MIAVIVGVSLTLFLMACALIIWRINPPEDDERREVAEFIELHRPRVGIAKPSGSARDRRRARRAARIAVLAMLLTVWPNLQFANAQLAQTLTTASVTCGTSATSLLVANGKRQSVLFIAPSSNGATVFVGNAGVTTANGIPIPAGQNYSDNTFVGGYFCIVAAATQPLTVIESTR